MSEIKADRTRNLRYKRPALCSMGFEHLSAELYEIQDACADIHWFIDQGDETLINALDGDESEALEFKIAFADLEAKCDEFSGLMQDDWQWPERFPQMYDDCTVALIGNCYRIVGYDTMEEDYYGLTRYEEGLAQTEAGKRLMRLTKPQMISTIGQCFKVYTMFLDLRYQYDYLKATFDILRGENTSMLKQIKEIEAAYEAANDVGWFSWCPEVKRFDQLLAELPERAWLE